MSNPSYRRLNRPLKRPIGDISDTLEAITGSVAGLEDFLTRVNLESRLLLTNLKLVKIEALKTIAKNESVVTSIDAIIEGYERTVELWKEREGKKFKIDANVRKVNGSRVEKQRRPQNTRISGAVDSRLQRNGSSSVKNHMGKENTPPTNTKKTDSRSSQQIQTIHNNKGKIILNALTQPVRNPQKPVDNIINRQNQKNCKVLEDKKKSIVNKEKGNNGKILNNDIEEAIARMDKDNVRNVDNLETIENNPKDSLDTVFLPSKVKSERNDELSIYSQVTKMDITLDDESCL